ncbi:MAG: hypothetical protein FWE95_02295 [Planctomycetaceae bacterium]|nr:hypothetical protein [Planctomycetaceae bacterium]
MIVSPRAKEVIDILRKEGGGFINIDEVFLYRRAGTGSPYRKVPYWKRGEDSTAPPKPKFTSFAIVPEMTAAVHRGFGVYAGAINAWRAFDRNVQTSGAFGTETIVSFPEAQWVRGFAIRFEYEWNNVWLAIEGKFQTGNNQTGGWTRLFESTGGLVNYGRYGALTTPMFCTAVRVLTDSSNPVQSCQFFDAVPLVPITMTSNTAPTAAGVRLISEPNNYNLFRCFTEQVNAYTHGTLSWYHNNGDWQSNRGQVSTKDQNRFMIHFDTPKTVCGFSVGGIADYYDYYGYFYANCLLVEGRQSDADFWMPLGEVVFNPAERRTRYFDFLVNRTVTQVRITVQDVARGQNPSNSTSVYLPPLQIYGLEAGAIYPPYGINVDAPIVPSMGQPAAGNVVIIEQDGRLLAVPTA